MQKDIFAPVPRRKLATYAAIIIALLVIGVVFVVIGGAPLGRALLFATAIGVMFLGMVAGTMWITGGKRSLNNQGRVVPIRLQKALPYVLGAILLSYLLQLFALIGKK